MGSTPTERRGPAFEALVRALLSLALTFIAATAWTGQASARELTIDDVMNMGRIERATISPDGKWIAAVLSRPAGTGEVYGRTYYETDPSRSDVWLISARTGERRNLTLGAASAAGHWCPTWSPDGRRLAMLSTRPERDEPRGGDNVRLYVWEAGVDATRRVSDAAMVIQTHYGSPMYRLDLRGGADGGQTAQPCSAEENAPFVWLDRSRLLAITLPPGGVSGLLDEQGRVDRQSAATAAALHAGAVATVTAAESGMERSGTGGVGELRVIDLDSGDSTMLASLPIYPFRGELTLSVSPDGRSAAVLATVGAIPPEAGRRQANVEDDSWTVQKRLGIVDLGRPAPVRWLSMPSGSRFPLELFGWSPDGRRLALRTRDSTDEGEAALLLVPVGPAAPHPSEFGRCTVGGLPAGQIAHEVPLFWVDRDRILLMGRCGARGGVASDGARQDWWLIGPGGATANLTVDLTEIPSAFRRSREGDLFAIGTERLLRLDPDKPVLQAVPGRTFAKDAAIAWPPTAGLPVDSILLTTSGSAGGRTLQQVPLRPVAGTPMLLPLGEGDEPVDVRGDVLIATRATGRGLSLRRLSTTGGPGRDLLVSDGHLRDVDWGGTRTIAYRGLDGQDLQAAVILPPSFRPGRRHPVITWVYPGMRRSGFDYWLDRRMPGIYNLQLYAARGYVVLIPEMPIRREGRTADMYLDMTKGAIPAVDRLVELGIADPARIGVMGQSMGGYAVYSLVTQTTRFKAAVAVAGITDLAGFAASFDPTARGYSGIEHERSYNWNITTYGGRASVADDQAGYQRESPILNAERVRTPLLMIHGERDARAPIGQAEALFYRLYRQGRPARLLRYWGENHALARSPANVRDILKQTLDWFDRFMPAAEPSPPIPDP